MRFFVVPDNSEGALLAASLHTRWPDLRVLPHDSGRPWVVGRWQDEEVRWAAAGARRIALLGRVQASAPWLTEYIAGQRDLGALADLRRELPGSYHTAAVMDRVVFVQGDLSTVREVFHGRALGVTVAADRPDGLAELTDAGIAEEALAVRLLAPAVPWPLSEDCLWEGIQALPPGGHLLIGPDGRGHVACGRPLPAPEVPLAEGAPRVREALTGAVRVRTHGQKTLSADLSGGMDSTSVCFLAAGRVDRLLTVVCESGDPAGDDGRWAALAATSLPGAEHTSYRAEDCPRYFTGLLDTDPDLEAPLPSVHTRAMVLDQARRMAAAGSTRHLTGHGGDELFLPTPAYLHDLLRRRPLRALGQVRAGRAVHRWRTGPTVAALLDRTSYADWLGHEVGWNLRNPIRGVNAAPLSGWGPAYRMPAWATSEAVHSVRHTLRQVARARPAPLSPLRGRHLTVHQIRQGGDLVRRIDRLSARHGVTIEAPFLDDQVVEAALALDYADCLRADRYKPALVEAMRGVVPRRSLGRRSKAEFSADIYAGLRANRRELLELCDGMRLASLGLVDAAALRAVVLSPPPISLELLPLLNTFACEVWLRSVGTSRPRSRAASEAGR
ncbi:asparagine synthase-related protein [Actinomadura sp. NEAU-AAG7]|uniref:asparagine synthase-related protein n=1 Tax=Actinomadura sp. NEAU-AAG7 TaxID=2839640 RepID=UPI001BE4DC0C|nr:asparagine synthase-related protein [Actinomadura sp. NEAU-AAG7]MBT2207340.1 asparagine synthase [Actinomadura sp. NEAU-AAG7]